MYRSMALSNQLSSPRLNRRQRADRSPSRLADPFEPSRAITRGEGREGGSPRWISVPEGRRRTPRGNEEYRELCACIKFQLSPEARHAAAGSCLPRWRCKVQRADLRPCQSRPRPSADEPACSTARLCLHLPRARASASARPRMCTAEYRLLAPRLTQSYTPLLLMRCSNRARRS